MDSLSIRETQFMFLEITSMIEITMNKLIVSLETSFLIHKKCFEDSELKFKCSKIQYTNAS